MVVQLEDTFTDMSQWWTDNFKITDAQLVSLSAKLDTKKPNYDYMLYAGAAGSALIAMYCLSLYFSTKKEEKTPKSDQVAEALFDPSVTALDN